MGYLKPCPFCGKDPIREHENDVFTIRCGNPECAVYVYVKSVNDLPTVEWNTRAEEPAEKTAHWDINCDGYYPFCSHCGEAAQHMSRFCPNCGRKMITRRHEDT